MLQRFIYIGLIVLVVIAIGIALATSGPRIPERGVLVVELSGPIPDAPSGNLLSVFNTNETALPTLILQIEKAAADSRMVGILLHIRGLQAGIAQIQELRGALQRAKDSGKQIVALLDMSDLAATSELYLASVADGVFVVPGYLGALTGVSGQFMHLGGLFEQIGVRFEYERIGAYKSAPETFAAEDMSEAARTMYSELLDGLYAQLVDGIARGRGLDPARVRELIDRAPSTAQEWTDLKLADGVVGREAVLARAGLEDAEEVPLATYMQVSPQELGLRNGPQIALIFGEGTIVAGGATRTATFAADPMCRALHTAAENPDYRAIVLRINSGGGSALASEQIWRAVRDAREKKPVIVSMSEAAASGGYYVASAANAIVAAPATQTGSIGVFVLYASMGKLFDKLGIHAETMRRGRLAGLASGTDALGPEERAVLRNIVESTYQNFVGRVAAGRKMSEERVDELGQGRVWLGARALEDGLVDELGGLHAAVRRAREASGIDPDVDPMRVIVPAPPDLFQQIRTLLRGELPLGRILGSWLPARSRQWLGLLELPSGIAYLPAHWIELRS